MNLRTCFLGLMALAFVTATHADIVSLTPAEINQGDTNTANYTDSFLTLTPFLGGVADTFSANAGRLGMDSAGSNVGAFNDLDTTVGNADDESLGFVFAAGAGLSTISYDFSRADGPGPNDGVVISGFVSDPGVSFSVSNVNLFAVYDAGSGSVRLNIPGSLFNGTDVFVNFNANASNGQSLLMTVNDTTQAGAQFAILGIGYTTAVPEPSTCSVLAFAAVALAGRRKRLIKAS